MPTADVTIVALSGSAAAITALALQIIKLVWINTWHIPDEQRIGILYAINYLLNTALLIFFLIVGNLYHSDMLYVYLTLGLVQSGGSHLGYVTLARGNGKSDSQS